MKKYNLINLSQIDDLSQASIVKYYKNYINPGIATFLKILGFDKYKIASAEGMYLYTECGRRIMDFLGGMSVLNHGHNHPRIIKAREKFAREKRLEICKAFVSQYQSVLAKNLAEIFPSDLQYSFFCNSGAEANEGALKIALLYQKQYQKDKIVYTDLGYHGKTFGAMSVSGSFSHPYSEFFKSIGGCIEVPFGDIDAFGKLIEKRNDIAVIILEAIKADLVLMPPKNYLKELYSLCKKHNIIMIIDEVFTGFGRTGRMFSFEYGEIVPDIVTFSKSFGGGKASIAGYIVKSVIFKKTYYPLKNCTIHTTTFGGLGEECATAIEALNIINDQDLVEKARTKGEYLLFCMKRLKAKYPQYIRDVRCIGLLGTFQFRSSNEIFGVKFLNKISHLKELLTGLFPAVVASELFKKHNILVYNGGKDDYLPVNPSLIVKKEEIETFINALDDVLSKNIFNLAIKLSTNIL
ncbi:MAG: aminotransferase class III-fold pyridoxal phosphate-dependent enzyme [Candidatus Omnitrophica bacterium]|nr:aminotransferase class III-fold pyridoxal phosphate-dependent enzyme [Candidatus Omnitrophota bacterium]